VLRVLQFKQRSKTLPEWFASAYYVERKITAETVARPVREYLGRPRGRRK
jgi:hypothetical protein